MTQNSARASRLFVIGLAGFTAFTTQQNAMADDTPTPAPTPASTDKSQYTLFNITPANRLRPMTMSADDNVTDPTTLDAGHVQIQGAFVDYLHYSKDFSGTAENLTQEKFIWGPRITIGVLNRLDVFIRPFFHTASYSYSGPYNASGDSSDFDGVNLGAKINFWGNDEGTTAFGIEPYVSIPNDDSDVTGGATLAFAARLPCDFYLKIDSTPHAISDGKDSSYFGVENSLSVHKSFGEPFDVFAYLNTEWLADSHPWYGYAGGGVDYHVCENVVLFGNVGAGLTSSSYDYNLRFGGSVRF